MEDLQKRLNESEFSWTSANVFQNRKEGPSSFQVIKGNDTTRVADVIQLPIRAADTIAATLGIFGVTIPSNPKDYVYYSDYLLEAQTAYVTLQAKQSDIIFGLTHLEIEQDTEVAKELPNVPLIMGGHEHDNMLVPVNNSVIAKADANAKTAYIHRCTYNVRSKKLYIDSYLMPITNKVASSKRVQKVVEKWDTILNEKIEILCSKMSNKN